MVKHHPILLRKICAQPKFKNLIYDENQNTFY
jgi:hypothetical protein